MLRLSDGSIAQSTEQRAAAWISHFAAQEAGLQVDDAAYVAAFDRAQLQKRHLDLRMIPTLPSVEAHILSAKTAKAAGPDGITAELLRLDAPIVARQLVPIFLKASLYVREPITFRGGDLMCLAKKAGQALSCDAYRSILISSVPGKLYHRSLRDSLKPLLLDTQPTFQAGVAAGQGIEGIALAVRSFYGLCQGEGTLASLTFFDLQAAFYQVLRQTLVPSAEGDAAFLELLHHLRLPADAIQELRSHLERLAQLPALDASAHAIALVQDLFRGTWFRLSGFSQLVLTRRGSRPGDPTADLLFGFTLSALIKSVQHCLSSRGLLPALPHSSERPDFLEAGAVPLGFPSWADDFVAPQTGDSAPSLMARTQLTITTVVEFATSAGMTVKFGRDKTALLLPPKVIQSSRDLLSEDKDEQPVLQLHNAVAHEPFEVPVIESYRHLGGIVTSTGTPVPDLHFRFAQASGTLRPLKRKLFGAREIPIKTRACLLRALVVSKFSHSAAALIMTAAYHVRIWEKHYLALWRALFHRRSVSDQLHSFRVLLQARASSPPLSLARARAGFLQRVYAHGPRDLLALLWDHWLLHPSSSWLKQIRDDVRHVSQYVPSVRDLLSGSDPVAQLLDALNTDHTWWLRQVKAAERVFFEDLEKWENERQLGALSCAPAPHTADNPFSCHLCDAAFPLRKHLHAHLAKAHRIFAPARHFAVQETCAACLRQYPTVIQLQQHLKHSSACLLRCVHVHAPLSIDQVRELEQPSRRHTARIAKGQWRDFAGHGAAARAAQAFGPRLPTAAERCSVPATDDDPLTSLSRGFVPNAAHVVWVTDHVDSRSREGPRTTAHRFWDRRPVSHLQNLGMQFWDAPRRAAG